MSDNIKGITSHRLFWPVIYLLFLAIAGTYINKELETEFIKVEEEEQKKSDEVKPAGVTLVVKFPENEQSFHSKLENKDSIEDFIEELLEADKLKYETTAYTYGTEISSVNGIKQTPNYKWHIYVGEINSAKDVTLKIGSTNLIDEETYYLVYENKPIPGAE